MAMNRDRLRITVNDEEARRLIERLRQRGADWRPAARRFHREMVLITNTMFERLRLGGTYRGETWSYFAPQYTRKTDGVTVPAWGGVPRLRGRGFVLGRLRRSGARLKQGDAVGQDTGHLRRSALGAVRLSKTQMVMGQNVDYASAFSRLRRFAFFHLPDDLNRAREILLEYLRGQETDG